ncbi:hypothetical protein ABVN58_05625 [Fusobacterium polymorphum]|jgi:hypothetical protein|uniref:Uncharacterized protein n=1 Tax=Fusobacterium nucleatum CTI-6 TaxID=1316587 RepID=U7TTE3_FUSNU|nr:hypothetical protein [Fusobacterium nucleatum]ERT47653.1 hypothetical protein HMPREF1767_01213 [Fusobacterium nucleatum CTI-6]DAT14778.1 MAG TPA: hypothetical protein [Caudoviricetes sp.]
MKKENKDEIKDPIEEKKVSNIVNYGKDGDIIAVETVGTFRNMMNYYNKPRETVRVLSDAKAFETVKIHYSFEEMPEFELILAQTLKINLENKEVDKTAENLMKFFDKEPYTFQKILDEIKKNSENRGFKI